MTKRLYEVLGPLANRWVIGGLIIGFFLFGAGFDWRNARLVDMESPADNRELAPALDGEVFGYSPAEANLRMRKLGEEGRRFYAFSELTLDLVFPFLVAALAALLAIALGLPRRLHWLLWIPLVYLVADLFENSCIVALAFTHVDNQPSKLAMVAATGTVIKWAMVFASIGLVLCCAVRFRLLKRS